MNNILEKIAYTIIMLVFICSFSLKIFATDTTDLQKQEEELQSKIDETSSEIAGVQTQMSDAMKEVSNITNDITASENKIQKLGTQIEELEKGIEEKQKNIEDQQKKYEEQKRLLDKRLVAVYESGNTTYLDVLLSSSSLSDFISKYYLVEKIAESDNELLTQIQELKVQIENEKVSLENSKQDLETSKKSEEVQQDTLERLKSEKEVLVSKLSNDEKELQEQLDEYEEDKKLVQSEIAKALEEDRKRREAEEAEKAAKKAAKKAKEAAEKKAAEEATKTAEENQSENSSVDNTETNTSDSTDDSADEEEEEEEDDDESDYNSSSSGFICPLAGRSSSDITTGYYGYSGHTGVDFARNSKGAVVGLPVRAAKSGTVIISKALRKSNGDYRSYGEYIVINHGDGTLSLYAHMQSGSRQVEVGDWVSQGQHIGNVGSTGNSTGPHLHFEIRLQSGGTVNPVNYLP